MQQRSIGNDTVGRLDVGAIGLGAMPLSSKEDRPRPAEADATVHAALDAGVTLIDTADAYAHDESEFGHNEELVARALRSYGDTSSVLVATKGGHTRDGSAWGLDGSPSYLRKACEASLRRLGVEAIGLYQFHRPDPRRRGRCRWPRCASCSTTAWCAWWASPTPPSRRSTRPARSSGTRW
ncbi:aldo/keto reductase [Blastococcus brunescens]|uniref:Aldo/keto reductase n=1 Tax=Blastococcus brunescens TaxID=1564165 RepID=A0ABZ1B739_9ACTN|nr:aldo/keto reductase [Blastococcus sp. BMG 8361]WRL66197.1 aldo/keto reductase [Blastococcus sp. BMG 8361]